MDKARHIWAKRVRVKEGLCFLVEDGYKDKILAGLAKNKAMYTYDIAHTVPQTCPALKAQIAQAHAAEQIVGVNNTYPTSALSAPGLFGADIIWEEACLYAEAEQDLPSEASSAEAAQDRPVKASSANQDRLAKAAFAEGEDRLCKGAFNQDAYTNLAEHVNPAALYTKKDTGYSFIGIGQNTILTKAEIEDFRSRFQMANICDQDLTEALFQGFEKMQSYERLASDCASVVATYLRCHPKVTSLRYFGLKQDQSKANAACVLRAGFGSSIDFQVGSMSCEEILSFTQALKSFGCRSLEVCEDSQNKEELWFRLQVKPCCEKEIIVALETALIHV